jgi:hypothetical protein
MQSLTKCTVVLDGAASGGTSGQVTQALEALAPGEALLVDMSKASEREAVELARLLANRRHPVPIRIHGLRRRDLQLLSYLGLTVDSFGEVVSLGSSSPSRAGDAAGGGTPRGESPMAEAAQPA